MARPARPAKIISNLLDSSLQSVSRALRCQRRQSYKCKDANLPLQFLHLKVKNHSVCTVYLLCIWLVLRCIGNLSQCNTSDWASWLEYVLLILFIRWLFDDYFSYLINICKIFQVNDSPDLAFAKPRECCLTIPLVRPVRGSTSNKGNLWFAWFVTASVPRALQCAQCIQVNDPAVRTKLTYARETTLSNTYLNYLKLIVFIWYLFDTDYLITIWY